MIGEQKCKERNNLEFKINKYSLKLDLLNSKLYINDKVTNLAIPPSQQRSRVYLKITESCNFKCSYCYQKMDKKNNCRFSLEGYAPILSKLLNNESADVYIFGGEPFLNQNFPLITYLLKHYTCKYKVFTNGSFSQQFRDLILEYPDRFSLIISLDGTESIHNSRRIYPDHNSYQEIIDNLDFLKMHDILVDIQINIDENNICDIPLLCKVIDKNWSISQTSIILNPVLHATNPPDNIKILEMYINLCHQYPQNQLTANIKSLKKLSSLITGNGLDPRRCTLDQTIVLDFLQHKIYCCPQSVKTEIGTLTSEGDIVLNQKNISSFVKKKCEKV